MVQLLIDYAIQNGIILNLNEKDKNGINSIFWTMNHNNLEMFKVLVEYSLEKGIKLIIDENHIKELISKHYNFVNLNKISDIPDEFIKFIHLNKNQNIIEFFKFIADI
jgi:ankyrin repeat protein